MLEISVEQQRKHGGINRRAGIKGEDTAAPSEYRINREYRKEYRQAGQWLSQEVLAMQA